MAKKKNTIPKMSIAQILQYFEHYFEIEEIQKFATDKVAEEYLHYLIERRFGTSEINQIGSQLAVAQSYNEKWVEEKNAEREKSKADEISSIKDFIKNNPIEVLKKRFNEIENTCIRCGNLDTYETYIDFREMCKIVAASPSFVRVPDLLLYCAFRSQTNLYSFIGDIEVYAGRVNKTLSGKTEIYDGKGDILLSENGKKFIRKSHQAFPEYVEPFNRKKMCSDSIKKMFKAQKELKKIVKKEKQKNLRLKFKRERKEKYETDGREYSFEDLEEALKTRAVWQNIDFTYIDEWINEGLLTPEEIIKAFREGKILPRDLAILNELGIIPQITEATKDNQEVQRNKLFAKLLLFSQDKESIELIEALLSNDPEQRDNITDEMLEELSWSFTNFDIRNSLYSLLIHDVLEYDQSMLLIDKLNDAEKLQKYNETKDHDKANKESDEEFLKRGIHDFKVNLIKNIATPELFDFLGEGSIVINTDGRLTIDPLLRAKYFTEIGGVKSIFIDGSRLINDEDGRKSKNSLDGYQLLIFPDKGVAVLEKFFETIHRSGKIEYKKDTEGNLIPAIDNATYVLPIEKAVEYATKKNKKDLRKIESGRATVYHVRNWVKNLEAAMRNIAPQFAKFDRDNTKRWSAAIMKDYDDRIGGNYG